MYKLNSGEKKLYFMLITLIFMITAFAFAVEGFDSAIQGFMRIQKHPARLINDFTAAGSEGGALLNSSLLGLLALILIYFNRIYLSGPTIAAVFTIMGFALFGKTILNAVPVILGVYLLAKIGGKSFSEYILIALFGTALGPMITFLVLECGLCGYTAVITGVFSGILAGLLLPPVAIMMLKFHQGYNLYNIGITCGFIGVFAAAFFAGAGLDLTIRIIWNKQPSALLTWFMPAVSFMLLFSGFLFNTKSCLSDYKKILKLTGRLPSDFMDSVSIGASLFNMGLLGLLCSFYVYAVGAPFNGPVIGGIFTVMGFGAFGKHIRNSLPVMAGVVISCLIFGKSLSSPGPVLAALFSTTLAPIAGEFGVTAGIAAGFIHAAIVDRTASWHGGVDLYNNGFAGGLTAALMIAVIDWYMSNKSEIIFLKKQDNNIFEKTG
jgi:hypothetical protein